jgi:quercetin dioxygenase-like cupin family protein
LHRRESRVHTVGQNTVIGSITGSGRGWLSPCHLDPERLTICVSKVRALETRTEEQGGRHAHTTRIAGFASCAICGITEFVATAASAQGAPPAASGGVTRKILSQADGPTPGYETLLVEATIEAGVAVGRHTHPGIESAYVMEGGFELPIQGQPTRMLKVGDAFQIPPETPHAGGKAGDAKSRILITYIVQKGKPLASPA